MARQKVMANPSGGNTSVLTILSSNFLNRNSCVPEAIGDELGVLLIFLFVSLMCLLF
jgi:hypothetical protein